ncbi:cytochrome P450 [Glonium stellatum]|uniref:Cytochrome P450 n=1 Tax=Glonium stellatum TaxID=574774 RepID=A0A8E2F6C1_9PEZI|nr:cytochrome P450 [Glonium stellatum]
MEEVQQDGRLESKTLSLLVVAVLACGVFLIEYFFGHKHHAQEPPRVPSAVPIPYLGHMIGLMRYKMGYYVKLSAKYPLPAYTVTTFGGKVYVVNSPELAVAVFRSVKALSFANIAATVVSRISLSSKEGTEIMLKNATGEEGDKGYTVEGFKRIHAALGPGPGLEQMTTLAAQHVAVNMGKLKPEKESTITRIMLYEWIQHLIAVATSDAVYGPMNPFQNPEVESAFWDFERNFTTLLVNIMPALTARRGHIGRERVNQAFEKYFRQEGHKSGSALVKARYEVADEYDVSLPDMARFETTMAIGILGTTSPAAFWMVFHIFSNPAVLEDLRTELGTALTTTFDKDGAPVRQLDITRIKGSPLLTSTWHEVLRHSACGTSARLVQQDCLIDNRFLLKKGNVVQMPSRVSHINPSLWGTTVDAFDSRRFLKQESRKPGEQKLQSGAFRPFGGGNTLCPGRHLAATEILAMVAMLALRFDLTPASGYWVKPTPYASSVAAAIYSPNPDIAVNVKPRKGYEGGLWTFNS